MINPKTYTPKPGGRIYRALQLMADGQARTRTEICELLHMKRYTAKVWSGPYYDSACVRCELGHGALDLEHPHMKFSERQCFTGGAQLFSRLTQGGDYWMLRPTLLRRVKHGVYVITPFGRRMLSRALKKGQQDAH